MTIVKVVGIILIFLALYSLLETMATQNDGERMIHYMKIMTDAGLCGQSNRSLLKIS